MVFLSCIYTHRRDAQIRKYTQLWPFSKGFCSTATVTIADYLNCKTHSVRGEDQAEACKHSHRGGTTGSGGGGGAPEVSDAGPRFL